jgi:hypothetical protein
MSEQQCVASAPAETNTATQEPNGRGGGGRFAAGNPGGPGNPFARQTAALRKAMLDAVTPEDIQRIVQALIDKASKGDVAASKLVLSYTIGKPTAPAEPDLLDQQELVLQQANLVGLEGLDRLSKFVPIAVVLRAIRVLEPIFAEVREQELSMSMQKASAEIDAKEQRKAERARERAEAAAAAAAGQPVAAPAPAPASPEPPTDPDQGQKDLAALFAQMERDSAMLRQHLGIKEGEPDPTGIFAPENRIQPFVDVDLLGRPLKREQDKERRRREHMGMHPSVNGSNGEQGG